MQQRRVRLGDIVDDYCPRERRITNHAVVAMIEDAVKQTRCTTCDADHEYKQAKVPSARRKKPEGALVTDVADAVVARPVAPSVDADSPVIEQELAMSDELFDSPDPDPEAAEPADVEPDPVDGPEDVWVHRPLIRATLPRPEGQVPERKATDFTVRQNGGRFEGERNGNRHRGPRQAQGHSSGQPRFGNPRSGGGGQGSGQSSGQGGQRQGNRPGQPGGPQRSGGRPAGPGRGQRPGGPGRGPKRGGR